MSFHKYFITTAIPYVNSKPHIGHAQEFVIADALARFYKSQGHDVVLQSGTDDNATKNVLAAEQAGVSTAEFVNLNSAKFQKLLQALNIETDFFVRTSSEAHKANVQRFIEKLNSDDVFESNYTGLYCPGCEDFYDEQDLVNGLCPDHLKKPEEVSESNRFFRLSKYQEKIFDLIESGAIKITPASKKKEILNFVRCGLADISLSRSALRTHGWGVPFPQAPDQTVYVWIDALINYISAAPDQWREDIYKVHVVGKNVWKFHAVYWPALLISAGEALPNEIVIHGFLTNDGTKISKSLGNGIDPFEIIHRYGADALRFYLLAVLSFEQDADFVEKNLVSSYNSELANKLGNLASRILSLARGVDLPKSSQKISTTADFFKLRESAFERIHALNAEINNVRPWELLKEDKAEKLTVYLNQWFLELQRIAVHLEPILPEGAYRLLQSIERRPEMVAPLYPRK